MDREKTHGPPLEARGFDPRRAIDRDADGLPAKRWSLADRGVHAAPPRARPPGRDAASRNIGLQSTSAPVGPPRRPAARRRVRQVARSPFNVTSKSPGPASGGSSQRDLRAHADPECQRLNGRALWRYQNVTALGDERSQRGRRAERAPGPQVAGIVGDAERGVALAVYVSPPLDDLARALDERVGRPPSGARR